jgi:hypothetical protein
MKKILLALSVVSLLGLSVSCNENKEEQEIETRGTETERMNDTEAGTGLGTETDAGMEESMNEDPSALPEQQEDRYPVDDSGQAIDNTQPSSTEAIEGTETDPSLQNQ